jgi:Fe-S-cluster containining protein
MSREDLRRELEELYGDLERELSALRPLCRQSGRCCKFKEFGHQLWTTELELDYLIEHQGLPPRSSSASEGVCPYLKDGLCGVREHRMLGCRIYFCDAGYAGAMGPLYEKYHARIRELHRRHDLPYEYREFLSALERRTGTKG